MRSPLHLTFLALFCAPAAFAQGADPVLGFQNGAEWMPLRVDGSRLGLRFVPGLDEAAVRAAIAAMPAVAPGEAQSVMILPGRTVIVETAAGTSANEALAAAEAIRAMEGVVCASPRLYALDDPYYLTEEVLVRWRPAADAALVRALTAGLVETATLDYSTNPGHVYRVPHGADPLAVANAIAASGAVEFAIPDFQLTRVLYGGATNDPLFPQQWHLETTGAMGTVPDADVDVQGAWPTTRGSSTVTIAVVDTGVELAHPDLVPNLVAGTDVLDDDPTPAAEDYLFGLFQESHATSVCGVASGAGNNGIGISGVAQQCKIMPIRFLSEFFLVQPTVQDEADAFNFARANGADVVNNSWGPTADAPLPASTKAAIDDCNANGRGGLGMVIFFAAGNTGADNSGNGYASYAGVVGVSAVTDQELLASYSSFGTSVDCCAPSNGGVNGITTTDRLGANGYSSGDYTNTFGGTSSASPCAAGVMLLVLSANPALTRVEAIDVLLSTAQKVDLAGGGYDGTGHSNRYGYGRVNAADAVAAASAGSGCELSTYCVTSPNSNGSGALIGSTGTASVAANDLVLTVTGAAVNKPGIFFYGSNQVQIPFGNGFRCAGGTTIRLPVIGTNASGNASFPLDSTDPPGPGGTIHSGETWNFQFWYRDPLAGGAAYNLSDALHVVFCD